MNNNELLHYFKTKIGDQYENYEFDVADFRPSQILENGLRYEVYEYTGKFKLPGKKIILYFNADILMRIGVVENKKAHF